MEPNWSIRLILRLYCLLLRLYPKGFQEEFSEEMQWVFTQTLIDAASRGSHARNRTFLREIQGVFHGAVLQHSVQKTAQARLRMPAWEGHPGRGEIFVTLLLFVLPILGLWRREAAALFDDPYEIIFVGVVAGALVTGLSRGLPRWSLPYLGIAISTISFFIIFDWQADLLSPLALEKIGLAPQDGSMRLIFQAVWAGMMWLSLFVFTLLTVGLLALMRRFRPFFYRLRQDWTLVSYILYSGALTLLALSFAQHHSVKLFAAGSMLCLAAGAWLYLYSPKPWQRSLTLITGMALSIVIAAAGNWPVAPMQLWPSWENWPEAHEQFWSKLPLLLADWTWMVLILLAPALLKRFSLLRGALPASATLEE